LSDEEEAAAGAAAGTVAWGFGFGVAVAVGVPATASEADGRRGDDALEMPRAVRADGDLGVGELLDFLSVLVAGGAFVFVKRHRFDFFPNYSLSKITQSMLTWGLGVNNVFEFSEETGAFVSDDIQEILSTSQSHIG
jgi:hypothetical protein